MKIFQRQALKFGLACCICFLAKGLSAQSLEGVISDDSTHRPLKEVMVYLPDLQLITESDANGRYQLAKLPAGEQKIQFYRDGYKSEMYVVNVHAGSNRFDLDLHPYMLQVQEVVITGAQSSSTDETPWTISSVSKSDIRESGSMNLSDAIAKLPGVSQLSTGPGISKPVIRGLSGNRIQTVYMGMRFDNQQWQEEHGLGLSDLGVDRVEVIKGPAALLYGSEAIGGVVNIIEEKPAPLDKAAWDLGTRFFSNTYGNATELGYRKSTEKKSLMLRAGFDSHADYSDGKHQRILNSRFGGYYGKATMGFYRKNFISVNNFFTAFNQYGFIMEDNQDKKEPDSRLSRKMDGPKHMVYLAMLTSQNTWFKEKDKLKLNIGLHSNLRMENEGGNRISLNMLLNSLSGNFQWLHPLSENTQITIGSQLFLQTNNNFGSRVIVPDARLGEVSSYGYLKSKWKKFTVEGGLRGDGRQVQTLATENFNQDDMLPFNRSFGALNGSLGATYALGKYFQLKAMTASGFRSGNLAELSSNGLHEGTYRFEIGDPGMKLERNLSAELSLIYESSQLLFNVSVFRNRFLDYIYLAPTGTQLFGFDIYRYRQDNAVLSGGETSLSFHPSRLKWLEGNASYSYLEGRQDNGNYLPIMPANRLRGELKFHLPLKGKLSDGYLKAGAEHAFAQDKVSEFEMASPAYSLYNAGAGANFHFGERLLNTSVVVNNILNTSYYDHLSRLRYYGINDMGRDVVLNLKMIF